DLADELGETVLWMAEQGRLCIGGGNRGEGGIVNRAVEAGQHHRAKRQAGDDRQKLGGGGNGAGGAGGDDRPGRWIALQPGCLQPDRRAAVRGGVGAVQFFQQRRPVLGNDLQKVQRHLPP